MKSIICAFLLFSLNSIFAQENGLINFETKSENGWGKFFEADSIIGTFALLKFGSDTLKIHNVERANKPYLPASTFKIMNALISLETKSIKDEKEIIKWDGKKRFYDKWNQDQNLKTGMKYSCVWFYQELARRVGEKRMLSYLYSAKYGNGKLGPEIDEFWLNGDLRISAIEQIIFLNKFLNNQLPFTKSNIELVKSLLVIESNDNYNLYAKTGWVMRLPEQIGWFVGFVEYPTEKWIFAINIDINNKQDASKREGITRSILKYEGIIN